MKATKKIANLHIKNSGWTTVHFEDGTDALIPPDAELESPIGVGEEELCETKSHTFAKSNTTADIITRWGPTDGWSQLKNDVNEVFGTQEKKTVTTVKLDTRDKSIMAQVALKEACAMLAQNAQAKALFSKAATKETAQPTAAEVVETAGVFFNFLMESVVG